MTFSKIYPMDAVFDTPADVPADVSANKRYAAATEGFTVQETADKVKRDFGTIDIVVHSLANGPEVKKPLLETSRQGYLAAMSASSYSFVSMVQRFGPITNPGGSAISLTYIASNSVIPGYGGGMSSAKAALESDTRVLAYEAGRKYKIRVNTISAGPLGSRAAKAIGFIDDMIRYSYANAPVQKELAAQEVGNVAAFLLSPVASAVTGHVMYVDNGLNTMGESRGGLGAFRVPPQGDECGCYGEKMAAVWICSVRVFDFVLIRSLLDLGSAPGRPGPGLGDPQALRRVKAASGKHKAAIQWSRQLEQQPQACPAAISRRRRRARGAAVARP